MQSGKVETLQLRDVPPPPRDPDAEPAQAAGASGEEAPVPRGAKLITSEMSIASHLCPGEGHADQAHWMWVVFYSDSSINKMQCTALHERFSASR